MDTQGGQGPATVPQTEIVAGLNDLLQLNHDAIGAYDIAIEKLEDRDHASQISGFRQDHERHIRELNAAIEELGGTPTNEPHATGTLKQGMQSLGALAGDKGALIAWRTNELQVRTKYDSYASKARSWSPELKRLVDEQALDEERHFIWVSEVLNRMGVPTADGLEQNVATRAREQMGSLSDKAQQVGDRAREMVGGARDKVTGAVGGAREKVSGAGESARVRAADGLDAAASRLDQLADQQAEAGGARAKAAGAAHRVAGGLGTTAEYVRSGDAQAVRTDLEQQVRDSPAKTLLTAFGIGFVIGRILR